MLWWTLIKHLDEFLKARPEFNDVDEPIFVKRGATRQHPTEFPTILLLRCQDRGVDLHMVREGKNYMWLEMWIRNDDPDPSVAYDKMAQLESTVKNALMDWVKVLPREVGIAARLAIPAWKGDGDTVRPKMVSQMTLEINWKR